jgi:hypothetical protein
MGPYCQYCGQRCFLLRTLPADATDNAGETILLATCPAGMARDRQATGHDHETAINPATATAERVEAEAVKTRAVELEDRIRTAAAAAGVVIPGRPPVPHPVWCDGVHRKGPHRFTVLTMEVVDESARPVELELSLVQAGSASPVMVLDVGHALDSPPTIVFDDHAAARLFAALMTVFALKAPPPYPVAVSVPPPAAGGRG